MIGKKEAILFDFGNEFRGGLLRFDIWFCGVRLTVVDNMAYPPSIICALEHELHQLKNKIINPDNFWFNFGSTTDDFSSRIYLSANLAQISVEFREQTYKLDISITELQEIYERALNVISARNT